jgi:uncharacterized protein (DUF58 family)
MYLLVSALLGFMAVSGLLGRGNLAGLRLSLEPPEEIYDGIETLVTVVLSNRRRRLPACLLRIELGGGAVGCILLPRGASVRLPLAITFHGRGVHRLPAARVVSNFPSSFFIRSLALPLAREVTVFPAPRPVRLSGEDSGRPASGEQPRGRGFEGDLTRIGDYRGGEPLKSIHWKLSARHDRLMIKELSDSTAPPLLIDLAQVPGADVEERLAGSCFLVNRAHRAGRPVGLRLGVRQFPPATGLHHKLHLLHELARYGRDSHPA